MLRAGMGGQKRKRPNLAAKGITPVRTSEKNIRRVHHSCVHHSILPAEAPAMLSNWLWGFRPDLKAGLLGESVPAALQSGYYIHFLQSLPATAMRRTLGEVSIWRSLRSPQLPAGSPQPLTAIRTLWAGIQRSKFYHKFHLHHLAPCPPPPRAGRWARFPSGRRSMRPRAART